MTGHLDAGYDSGVTHNRLAQLGFDGEISRKGVPAPIQVGKRWVVERTHSWMNGYGKLRDPDSRTRAEVVSCQVSGLLRSSPRIY